MGSIYVLIDPITGEIRYVGWTTKTLAKRLVVHLRDRDNNHRTHWCRSVIAQGETPIIQLVQVVPQPDWQNAERYWIAFFRQEGCPLTNATDGGDGTPGRSPSVKTRAKIREGMLRYIAQNGVNPQFTFKGHNHDEEARARQKKASSHPMAQETRNKIAQTHTGMTPTNETRIKLKAAKAGKYVGTNNPMFGKTHSPETRAKIGAANRAVAQRRNAR